MFPLPALLNPLAVVLSISTASGVFVHDSNIDKATLTALNPSIVRSADPAEGLKKLGNTPHTHDERGSLSQAVRDIKGQKPRIHSRNTEDREYVTGKKSNINEPGSDYIWPSV